MLLLVFCTGGLLHYFCSGTGKPEQTKCARKNITCRNAFLQWDISDSVISLGRHYAGNQAASAQKTCLDLKIRPESVKLFQQTKQQRLTGGCKSSRSTTPLTPSPSHPLTPHRSVLYGNRLTEVQEWLKNTGGLSDVKHARAARSI